ncbi:transglutaminase [Haloferula helveola]|uniref:Transglutaminase n=1 Tax=Haloferula helveola TaxID=490095 RepID=A0ABM7RIM0_9BACT|nr:transglutaminase [Haloferula helveola]
MAFHIQAELRYTIQQRSTMLLNLHALSTTNQILSDERFTITQGATCEFLPQQPGESRFARLDTGDLDHLLITYEVKAETNPGSRLIRQISSIPVGGMQRSHLPFLFPSRYCQSDRLGRLANRRFGHINHPLAQARAISDWVFDNIEYVPGTSDATTSACDTITQRAGVCRDFAHLAIALCRALSIPARYFAGYACNMQPPDFHACFEACVGNQWFIFDPTRLSSPNGLIRIATGRDAADAAVATIFGAMQLETQMVSCTADRFTPLGQSELDGKAILLEP